MNLEFYKENNLKWFLCTNDVYFTYAYSLDIYQAQYINPYNVNKIDTLTGELTKILEYT